MEHGLVPVKLFCLKRNVPSVQYSEPRVQTSCRKTVQYYSRCDPHPQRECAAQPTKKAAFFVRETDLTICALWTPRKV